VAGAPALVAVSNPAIQQLHVGGLAGCGVVHSASIKANQSPISEQELHEELLQSIHSMDGSSLGSTSLACQAEE
jgi:hypothetical protein